MEGILFIVNEDRAEKRNISKEEMLRKEFEDVFKKDLPNELPPEREFDHEIVLEGNKKPPYCPLYRMSGLELKELRNQLEELLDKKIIEPSKSPFGASVLFIKKKDGSHRMCVDYRAL